MGKIFPQLQVRPRFTSVGSYPLAYIVSLWEWHQSKHTITVCAPCADKLEKREAYEKADQVEHVDAIEAFVHWEGEPEICEECNEEIESAYGVPAPESEAVS